MCILIDLVCYFKILIFIVDFTQLASFIVFAVNLRSSSKDVRLLYLLNFSCQKYISFYKRSTLNTYPGLGFLLEVDITKKVTIYHWRTKLIRM